MQVMAHVIPFRPWLYNETVAGPLDRLVAPPYDVISPDLQAELYQRSPYNVVRVDLNREPGEARYTEAARLLADWKGSGALRRATAPQATVIEETFVGPDGRTRVRKGVLALVRLADFEEGIIFPHEFTLSGPKEDRFRLMEATRTCLSPVFMLYSRPDDAVMVSWNRIVDQPPDSTLAAPNARQGSGRRELIRLWHTSNPSFLASLAGALSGQALIIADGHHRYETALRYRDARRAAAAAAGQPADPEAPYEYALTYLVNMADPGLAIFGTHRLIRDLPREAVARLPHVLARYFTVAELADRLDEAAPALQAFLEEHQAVEGVPTTAFGLYLGETQASYGLVLRPEARRLAVQDAAEAAAGARGVETAEGETHSQAYRALDVTVLQDIVLDRCLGISVDQVTAGAHVSYAKEWDEALHLLGEGAYQAGFFLNPTQLEQVREIATTGERMPQKSTYFYPKLPTGLLFHDLADGI